METHTLYQKKKRLGMLRTTLGCYGTAIFNAPQKASTGAILSSN